MISRKRNTNITKLLDSISTSETETTRTETWVGPYNELKLKQAAAARSAHSTSLTPEDGGNGRLTITYTSAPPSSSSSSTPPIIEVEWVELRKKLQEHPRYASLSQSDRQTIEAALNDPANATPPTSGLAAELYSKLLRGQTEYSIAVPVVRRTTYSPTALSAGGAWFRNNPPVSIAGWQWLKTANRVSRQGTQYTRVEEWTGAQKWDTDIYP